MVARLRATHGVGSPNTGDHKGRPYGGNDPPVPSEGETPSLQRNDLAKGS